ncbi:MAG: efflux RND transporter periplasmic adaptor subunit [Verrucomicrobiales bacterium]
MDSETGLPPAASSSARRGWLHGLVAVGVLGAGVSASALMFSLRQDPPRAERTEWRTAVEVLTVSLADHQVQVLTQGFVAPVTETKAASELAGRILAVSPGFVVGGRFAEGDVLVEIDPADFEAAVAQAEGALAEARLALANEKARADQARRDWARLEPGETPGPLVLREPHLAAAGARQTAAEAALDKARRDLERTKIRAPYPGLIKAKRADVGDYVTPGTPLAELWRSDVFEIRLPVSVNEAAFIDLSAAPVAVLSDGVSEWTAPVVRTEGIVDPATRSTALIARLERPDPAPTPGLFVKARVGGRTLEAVATVPRRALNGPDRVVVVDDAGTLRFRPITVAWQETASVHVSDGLRDGDRVVLTALAAVVEGMPVEVLKERPAGEAAPAQPPAQAKTPDGSDGPGA